MLLKPYLRGRKLASLEWLSGGFSNANYKISLEGDGPNFHLRLPRGNLSDFKKEMAILEKLRGKLPVAAPLYLQFEGPQPFAVTDFVHGRQLDQVVSLLTPPEQAGLGQDLGRNLARIHKFNMGSAGFFDDRFNFSEPFPHFGKAWLEFTTSSMARSRVRRRMGKGLHGAMQAWLTQREELLRDLDHQTQLIHCDFNGKNILVQNQGDQWITAAVLDWEFACSGDPLVDLGNFFRFEEQLPAPLKSAFVQGYEGESGALPTDWRVLAGILDVAAMLGFLISDREMPNSFKTARAICEKTLHLY